MSNLQKEYTKIAFDYLNNQKTDLDFYDVWKHVCTEKELSAQQAKEAISDFYFELILDRRFVMTNNNHWTLRKFDANYNASHANRFANIYNLDEEKNQNTTDGEELSSESDESNPN